MIHYRKAILNDIPELVRLRVTFLKEVMKADEPDDTITRGLAHYFSEHLQMGDYINWLALDEDKIISTGGISFYSCPPNFANATGNRAYILNVYTIPGYRRKGVSKQLFEKLMQEARDRNVLHISLHATDEGINLYKQFGFKPKDNEMVWGGYE